MHMENSLGKACLYGGKNVFFVFFFLKFSPKLVCISEFVGWYYVFLCYCFSKCGLKKKKKADTPWGMGGKSGNWLHSGAWYRNIVLLDWCAARNNPELLVCSTNKIGRMLFQTFSHSSFIHKFETWCQFPELDPKVIDTCRFHKEGEFWVLYVWSKWAI